MVGLDPDTFSSCVPHLKSLSPISLHFYYGAQRPMICLHSRVPSHIGLPTAIESVCHLFVSYTVASSALNMRNTNILQRCVALQLRRRLTSFVVSYCMDRVSFCNVCVIQQDTQYLTINFIHNIQ